eukprot:CAMPEP_0172560030 /NCGR_PEP_ID=MMETSP1067-20121228/86856_1 /TAXON_ID=265564 ORGANISM="Thalassiosira punctigera, Strain Tpunct2005C2" /NCGR_SAMPLE_ID=MMETSP1067 /ASSEMBLY_ACC=CAM_ASM_000444 /LENGTH=54 /DNA_ID=CAMNT_0013349755 /DNA_START=59 /DNA_END=220 /DNA_ORIENTATION=+
MASRGVAILPMETMADLSARVIFLSLRLESFTTQAFVGTKETVPSSTHRTATQS